MTNSYSFNFYSKSDFENLLKIVIEFRQHLKREKKKLSVSDKEKVEKEERKFLKANSTDKNYRFYVCQYKNDIVGFTWFGKQDADKTKGFIGELYVRPGHRKNGIATKLLYEAKKWIKENNCIEIEINVFTTDQNAINLYEKLGYKRQKHYAVTYKKRL